MHSFALVGLLAASFATGVTADIFKRGHPKQITPSSVSFSFTDGLPSASPSGTGAQPVPTDGSGGPIYLQCRPIDPNVVPVPDPNSLNNATLTLTPSDSAPTDMPSVSASGSVTGALPVPTGGYGSGASIYICQPIDSSAVPQPSAAPTDATSTPTPSVPVPTSDAPSISAPSSDTSVPPPTYATWTPTPSVPVPTSDAPSVSAPPSDTSVPPPMPTDGQGSGGPSFICYPVDSQAIPTPSGTPDDSTLTPTPSVPLPTPTASTSDGDTW